MESVVAARKVYKRGGEGGEDERRYMKKLFLSDAFHHRRDVRRTTSIRSDTGGGQWMRIVMPMNSNYKFQAGRRCCNL